LSKNIFLVIETVDYGLFHTRFGAFLGNPEVYKDKTNHHYEDPYHPPETYYYYPSKVIDPFSTKISLNQSINAVMQELEKEIEFLKFWASQYCTNHDLNKPRFCDPPYEYE